MRFQSDMKKEMQKRQVPLQLNLGGGFEAPKTFDPSKAKIIGTSTQVFKPYLRLTCAPEPWEVRTKAQLPKSFKVKLLREHKSYSIVSRLFLSDGKTKTTTNGLASSSNQSARI